jgi:hypothetical protein
MNNDFNDIFDKKQLEQNPFRGPEGYFDSLNKRIMDNVAKQTSAPKSEKPAKVTKVHMHVLRWAAACACVLIVGASALIFTFKYTDTPKVPETAQQTITTSEDAFNQAADYTMLDNHDMYQMLAEE